MRSTHLSTTRDGSTVTTTVSAVDPRTGERHDVTVITGTFEPLRLAIEERGHEVVLAERIRNRNEFSGSHR